MNIKTHCEVFTSSKPFPSADGGLFCAGVEVIADLKSAVVRTRVATKQGVGK